MKTKFLVSTLQCLLTLAFATNTCALNLDDYQKPSACFSRSPGYDYTMKADSHIHFLPFAGPTIPYIDLIETIKSNGVLFAGVMGIGQRLPDGSVNPETRQPCESYRDCPGVPARPSPINDQNNFNNYEMNSSKLSGIVLNHSLTFPDLADSTGVVQKIRQFELQYPNIQFRMLGEVNLVKQALFPNLHVPVTLQEIDKWSSFMPI